MEETLQVNNKFNDPKYIDLESYKNEIIKLYNEGIRGSELAKRYNINVQCLLLKLKKFGIDTSTSSHSRGAGKNNHSWKGYKDVSATFMYNAKKNNGNKGRKRRNISFEISIKEVWEIYIKQNKKCIFTNEELKFDSYGNAHDGNISLDRIDCNFGYTKDNCQLTTKQANRAKGMMSDQEFRKFCDTVSENNKKLNEFNDYQI